MISNRKLINAIGYCFNPISKFTIYKPKPTIWPWMDNDVTSLYPGAVFLGYKTGEKVVLSAGRRAGKSEFMKQYYGEFKQYGPEIDS